MSKRAFQRYVLLSEDTYRGAVRCLEKDALARTMEHSAWFERDGALHRIEPPAPQRPEPPGRPERPEPPTPARPERLEPRYRVPSPSRVVTRAAKKQQQKGSGVTKVRILRV